MKLYQLLDGLIEKFVPIQADQKTAMSLKASDAYGKLVSESKDLEQQIVYAADFNLKHKAAIDAGTEYAKLVPKKALKYKVADLMEQWFMHYLFSIMFVFLVPKINSYINGETSEKSSIDSPSIDFEDWMEFKRFQKRA